MEILVTFVLESYIGMKTVKNTLILLFHLTIKSRLTLLTGTSNKTNEKYENFGTKMRVANVNLVNKRKVYPHNNVKGLFSVPLKSFIMAPNGSI